MSTTKFIAGVVGVLNIFIAFTPPFDTISYLNIVAGIWCLWIAVRNDAKGTTES